MRNKIFVGLIIVLLGCDSLKKSEKDLITLTRVEVPSSSMGFEINFPVKELEKGINQVLPKVLTDGGQPMKDPKDTLFLKIERRGDLSLKIDNGLLYASIPMEISASIKKRVMGMTFSTEDAPVQLTGTIKATADMKLRDDWELDLYCRWEGFDWKDQPQISIAGLTFDVGSVIDDYFASHSDELSDIICQSIESSISLREVLLDLWEDVRQPMEIDLPQSKLWFNATPIGLAGAPVAKDDTLCLHVEYQAGLELSSEGRNSKNIPLPTRKEPLNKNSMIVAYPGVFISYSQIANTLDKELTGQTLDYEGYNLKIKALAVSNRGQQLKLSLETEGDINGSIHIYGTPSLDNGLIVSLKNFEFEMESDEEWVKLTDMALHSMAENYIESIMEFDMKPFVVQLDDRINGSIENLPIGEKINLKLKLTSINQHEVRMTEKGLQWIFLVEGYSSLNLKSGLFR